MDPNGDGVVSSLDALFVLNILGQRNALGEGESVASSSDAATAATYAVTTTYAGTVNAALPAANFVASMTDDDHEQEDAVSTIDETDARDALLTGGLEITDAASEDVADSIAVEAAKTVSETDVDDLFAELLDDLSL